MSDERTLCERLEGILKLVNVRADFEIERGEEMMKGQTSFAAIGFATGARFVRDVILDEFQELWPDKRGGE